MKNKPYKTLNLVECLSVCLWYRRYKMGNSNARLAVFTQIVSFLSPLCDITKKHGHECLKFTAIFNCACQRKFLFCKSNIYK